MSKAILAAAILVIGALTARAAEGPPKTDAPKADAPKTEPLKVELNALDATAGKCRMSFVVQNGSGVGLDSLKLDLALFGRDGAIQRRLLTEMGPVRAAKTVVRAFEFDGDCASLGAILVNEVPGCVPASFGDCLDRMSLASRLASVRFYK